MIHCLLLFETGALKVADFVYETDGKRIITQYIYSMGQKVFKQSKLLGLSNISSNVNVIGSFETFTEHIVQLEDEAQLQRDVDSQLQCYFFCAWSQKSIASWFAEIIRIDDTYKCSKEKLNIYYTTWLT